MLSSILLITPFPIQTQRQLQLQLQLRLQRSSHSVLEIATSLGISMAGMFSIFEDGISHDLLLALRLVAFNKG